MTIRGIDAYKEYDFITKCLTDAKAVSKDMLLWDRLIDEDQQIDCRRPTVLVYQQYQSRDMCCIKGI